MIRAEEAVLPVMKLWEATIDSTLRDHDWETPSVGVKPPAGANGSSGFFDALIERYREAGWFVTQDEDVYVFTPRFLVGFGQTPKLAEDES